MHRRPSPPGTEVPFRLVDVFCERPLAGNQLCVVPEPGSLDDAAMQSLAREIGFSETTFVTAYDDDRFSMRIFTPDAELPFAGHPTLGTAFVMVAEGRVRSPLTQVVAAGEFPVEVDLDRGFATMHQLPPTFGPEIDDLAEVAAGGGLTPADLHPDLPPRLVSTGLPHLLVPVRDEATLRRATRNDEALRALWKHHGPDCIYLFALTDQGATARLFDAGLGIGEDPATGSAAGPLGAYLAARGVGGMPGKLAIRQGDQVGRPSVLHVEVEPEGDSWSVRVSGGVVIVGGGSFRI
ncbi:MAG TPA: PhzF family phenazine biosynthesis protein [Actinomycetota bacterium]|jgi:trans-2,3-dihydro-3-hydroxyanthranilate isomerase|nr:PhzF family phenazine biosynthesis protein [Actinomycetota bacterium]